ncbi:phosphoribosylglycinamide formyltransferase [Agrococcus sp. SL85]|uniref:phosphoribosylglycinamide formyltransferase n=1 Tax=Agrococcus sp. SL85 TaxID=2995141 RepID=UPI00226CC303|nr:phosphoribosylglycinamide formyltransferase [Agrococcus sp. SL85]WAC67417.1 phosphoribosylglycinamide formyltransferase [Agrococcus sp. SL85]
MLRLVVLVSGSGTNFADLLERTRDGRVPAEVVAVGADRECPGLDIARAAGIPTFVVPFAAPRAEWSARIADRIAAAGGDLVVLSGFMRLLSPEAVARFSPALLNTHPAHLPEFPGAHGVRDALAAGVAQTGASVIVVDAGVDTGPILAQRRIAIEADDDEASLHDRIKLVERDLLASVLTDIAEGAIDLHEAGARTPNPEEPTA